MATGRTNEVQRLSALKAWMVENRVLTLTSGDVTILLSPDALPLLPQEPTGDSFPDEAEYLTPHERIRVQHAAEQARKTNGDAQ